MKKIAFLLLVVVCSKIGYGQCGKASTLTSSQTEYLDATHAIQRVVEEKTLIEITKSEIVIMPGSQPRMTATIISDSCEWKKSFSEGKSVMKVIFAKESEKPMNATITLEGRDGKIFFLVEMSEMPDKKIRVIADKFEEKI